MEELLEVLQSEDSSSCSSESENDLMLLAPLSASSKPRQRRTMRLHGMIDKQLIQVQILLSSVLRWQFSWIGKLQTPHPHVLSLLMALL
jgi:hypothetical protein